MIVELRESFLDVTRRVAFDKPPEGVLVKGAPVPRTLHILEPDGAWVAAELRVPWTLHVPSHNAAYLMTLRVKPGIRAREYPTLYYSHIVIDNELLQLKYSLSPDVFRSQ